MDPNELNKATIPMTWPIPRMREKIQENLKGVKWMCQFDFVSMFWQIPLHEDSRKLFSFYAGDLGTYKFHRVAMGALNSSIYTQRLVERMFSNVIRKDGKPLLDNGLLVLTDDVLLYAQTQEEMLEILELFMHAISCHKLAMHPGKCKIFCTETVFCGHHVSRQGVTVDPERLAGLVNISPPRHVGDVWQFNSAAGWIREDVPLFSEAVATLSDLVTQALKKSKKRNMAHAKRITLK